MPAIMASFFMLIFNPQLVQSRTSMPAHVPTSLTAQEKQHMICDY
ncbi:hypothetical protein BBKW_1399 [Bifidobacterium catenulatum subsp. kashiwanohense JCM 15439 = DSM 21854]|nr:hypothetical protein BBKW_1399 [Bifidobacterium catenulatum subsp. kashiwanohense JCM 15439 = DSM 21854]